MGEGRADPKGPKDPKGRKNPESSEGSVGSEDSKARADRIHALIERSKAGRTPEEPPEDEEPRAANPREAIHRRMRELDADASEVPDSDDPAAPKGDATPKGPASPPGRA